MNSYDARWLLLPASRWAKAAKLTMRGAGPGAINLVLDYVPGEIMVTSGASEVLFLAVASSQGRDYPGV
jgi:hypothetical protein